jgi:hypothetical protein
MMAAAWPASLPQCPILNAFSEQRQRNVRSFNPDVGPPKMGRRSTAVGVKTNTAWRMTNAQVITFNTFYETTLADGTLPFDWPHPITKVSYTWMFDTGEAPTFERYAPRFQRVSFQLIRLP